MRALRPELFVAAASAVVVLFCCLLLYCFCLMLWCFVLCVLCLFSVYCICFLCIVFVFCVLYLFSVGYTPPQSPSVLTNLEGRSPDFKTLYLADGRGGADGGSAGGV